MAVFGVTDFANLPSTTVSSGGTDAPAPGTTETFTVASAAGWPGASSSASPPTGFSFADTALPGEVMRCVNRSGTTWTVTRGSEGTTPVSHQAGFTIVQVTSAGDLTALARVDWLNAVTQFGADPTGTADSTTAINTALTDAAPGQPVYLPTGTYKTTAPILIPPAGVLTGDFSDEVATYLDSLNGTVIQPAASWSHGASAWSGIISVLGQSDGGYSVISEEQKILGLMVDCHLLTTGSADGIQLYGGVGRARIENVEVAQPPGNGFNPVADGAGNGPGSYRLKRFNVRYAGGSGFVIFKTSDISAWDCLAENCAVDGWTITNLSNGMLVGCRAEHNGTPGTGGGNASGNGFTFTCTNSGTGSGTAKFVSCSSDRNQANGWEITSSNNSGIPVQLVGCQVRRDGQNATAASPSGAGGGSFAGVYIHAYPGVVQLSGTSIWPGVNDDSTGANSPQIGLRIASNNSNNNVIVGATYIQGASTGLSDDLSGGGTYFGLDVLAATGTTNSPTVFGPRAGSASLSGGTATVACTAVRTQSQVFVTPTSHGANSGGLSVTKNPGTGFTVTSTNGSDGNSFDWMCTTP